MGFHLLLLGHLDVVPTIAPSSQAGQSQTPRKNGHQVSESQVHPWPCWSTNKQDPPLSFRRKTMGFLSIWSTSPGQARPDPANLSRANSLVLSGEIMVFSCFFWASELPKIMTHPPHFPPIFAGFSDFPQGNRRILLPGARQDQLHWPGGQRTRGRHLGHGPPGDGKSNFYEDNMGESSANCHSIIIS